MEKILERLLAIKVKAKTGQEKVKTMRRWKPFEENRG
jgi:hypothetical protein